MSSGGSDLKKCMQCGTCSVVCTLAPDDATFPRRQMLEAQWGLKERLVGDPALWLCHGCGDCSAYCPRGARPGEVFGALREQAIRHFAWPGFLAKISSSPRYLPLLLALPVLVFAAIATWARRPAPGGDPEFAHIFPIPVLEAVFFALSGFAILVFAAGIARFLKALRSSGQGGRLRTAALTQTLLEVMSHSRFSKCGAHQSRRIGHLLTFWGFVGLAATGTVVGIGTMIGIMQTPLALTSPWKIFANVCALVVAIGCIVLVSERLTGPAVGVAAGGTVLAMGGIVVVPVFTTEPWALWANVSAAVILIAGVAVAAARAGRQGRAGTWFDWFFILTLTGVVVTGILSELLRLAHAAGVMYGVYFVHLVLIFVLFLCAPYSKFAHMAYRTVAMVAATRSSCGGGPSRRPAAADRLQ
jgi:quinone-modifying oxidoreductase subunit QmoC